MDQVLKREFLISKANVRSTGKRAWIHVWWVEFIYSVVPPLRNKLTESLRSTIIIFRRKPSNSHNSKFLSSLLRLSKCTEASQDDAELIHANKGSSGSDPLHQKPSYHLNAETFK
ncbi:hypothetical protein DSO57_1039258 [Entomophthora muscae]|uniref:Uncharacterized protein n=2 Tax=Entomophthora muscae TaxID=34485 RepID=A0ACC2TKI5_9FUNG|nr:hypothetical protein DSO57_1038030 [Entomophthora muscae]KAJ9079076.1 hypothetical protein DSO57_1039258 [Entomophthora muscae]